MRDVILGEDGVARGLRLETRAARECVARRGDGNEGGQRGDDARKDDLDAEASYRTPPGGSV